MINLNLFTTPIIRGQFSVTEKMISEYSKWVEFEKLLDPDGSKYSTTMNGWQRPFGPDDRSPPWIIDIQFTLTQIMETLSCNNIKSSWVVEYETGGYQDPHMHTNNGSNWTTIFNIKGTGHLLLHDPRPHFTSHTSIYVEELELKVGDFVVIPSWLIHSSRPSVGPRSIYVADIR